MRPSCKRSLARLVLAQITEMNSIWPSGSATRPRWSWTAAGLVASFQKPAHMMWRGNARPERYSELGTGGSGVETAITLVRN